MNARADDFYPLSGRERAIVAAAYLDMADLFAAVSLDLVADDAVSLLRMRATKIHESLERDGWNPA